MGSENCGFCSIYGEACDATGVLLGKDVKKVPDATNRANSLWEIRLRCRNWGLTPLSIPQQRMAKSPVFSSECHIVVALSRFLFYLPLFTGSFLHGRKMDGGCRAHGCGDCGVRRFH